MGSLGVVEGVKRRKAMWLYPKVMGFNPPERWGHSACFFDGSVYVFGGCCGGLHFSDVLALNLETMAWSSVVTTGQKPGTRDSHSVATVGHKMLVLGGTNGVKKVNDLHVLDLKTKEWSKPDCKGTPPSARESHTATVVGDDKLVIFGGSGEGDAHYLNDVHVLDLNNMTWISPEVKGDSPAPRDSHTSVAIGYKLLIYGGDCGDRYHGEVDVLDMGTMTWSRLAVQGSTPGVRAGHTTVNIRNKVYVIGGVGDKQYYNDVWVLDVATCSWSQLDIRGQQPQGRFSHTAVLTNTDIAIYGGCGEDERPLNELLILQLGSEHPNGRYNISMCKIFGNHWGLEKRKFLKSAENLPNCTGLKNAELNKRSFEVEAKPRNSLLRGGFGNLHAKRRKTNDARVCEVESEQEEHSLSLSQHSSPSLSDQEQNTVTKLTTPANESMPPCQQYIHLKMNHHREQVNGIQKTNQDLNFIGGESPRHPRTEPFLRVLSPARQEAHFLNSDQKPSIRSALLPIIGADVRGTVDGAFDSGYLMTANVNGQIFRGVLFAPGPGIAVARPALHSQSLTNGTAMHAIPAHVRPLPQPTGFTLPERIHHARQPQPQPMQVVRAQPIRLNSDLQGIDLTLGGPGGCSES